MRKVFLLAILFILLLSGCGTLEIYIETTQVGNSIPPEAAILTATPEPGLSMSSTSEEIRQFMLESATNWKSVWMDGTVSYFALEGTDSQTTTTREQAWIDLPANRFRVLMGPAEGEAQKYLASDMVPSGARTAVHSMLVLLIDPYLSPAALSDHDTGCTLVNS